MSSGSQGVSKMQEHYNMKPESAGNFPKEFDHHQSSGISELLSTEDNRRLNPQHSSSKDHLKPRMKYHDTSGIDDEVFAMSDKFSQRVNDEKQNSISIKASHASELQDAYFTREDDFSSVSKMAKGSRPSIGNLGNSGSLNNLQSESFQSYMAKSYQRDTEQFRRDASGRIVASDDKQYQSNFGQDYMKQMNRDMLRQKDDAQYRKSQKLQNNYARESTAEQQKMKATNEQLQRRKERKQQEQMEQSVPDNVKYTKGAGMGTMAQSFFNADGRQDQSYFNNQERQDRIANFICDDPEDQSSKQRFRDSITGRDYHDPRAYDTIHPAKLKQMEIQETQRQSRQLVQQNIFGDFGHGPEMSETNKTLQRVYQEEPKYRSGLNYYKQPEKLPIFASSQSAMSFSNTVPPAYSYKASPYGNYPHEAQYGDMYGGLSESDKLGHDSEVKKMPYTFYENCSKQVSLKKFSEDLYQFYDFKIMKGSCYNGSNEQFANKSICDWFDALLFHERAIVATIFDPKLVSLVKAMQQMYLENSHGIFEVRKDQRMQPPSPHKECLHEFKLDFVRESFKPPAYDIHGAVPIELTQKKKRKASEDFLIHQIRLIRTGNDVEAICLSNEILENHEFLFRQMSEIDMDFLNGELKLEKIDLEEVQKCSVVIQESEVKALKEQQEYKAKSKKKESTPLDHWVLNKRDGKTRRLNAQEQLSNNIKHSHSSYSNVGLQSKPKQAKVEDKEVVEDKQQRTLGQMLCHLFEKAINIQYMDFKGRLSKEQQRFFFKKIEQGEYQVEAKIIWKDMCLAKYLMDLSPAEKERFWSRVSDQKDCVVQQIKEHTTYKSSTKDVDEIKEESDEDEPRLTGGSKLKRLDTLRQLKDSDSDENHSDHEDKWVKKQKNRMVAHKFKGHLENDEEEEEEDLEQGKYNQGYQRIPSEEPILQTKGKGYKALDSGSDRTDTDHSMDKPLHQMKRKTDHAQRQTVLSKMHHEVKQTLKYPYDKTNDSGSNYENETFEEPDYTQQHDNRDLSDEDDMDDDFNLPSNHEQNQPYRPNKKIFEDLQAKIQHKKGQVQEPSVTEPKRKKKRKKNKKTEEEKSAKQELPQFKKPEKKECQVERLFKKEVGLLKIVSLKLKQAKPEEDVYQASLEEHYKLIRQISTYETLPTTKQDSYDQERLVHVTWTELLVQKLYMYTYNFMSSEYEQNLVKGLKDEEIKESEKKGKKKKKAAKKEGTAEEEETGQTEPEKKRKAKKNKKKKDKKEPSTAEASRTEEQQVETQIEQIYMDEVTERRREASPTQIKSNSNKKEPQRMPSPNVRNQISSVSRRNIPQTPDSKDEIRKRNFENQGRLEGLNASMFAATQSEGNVPSQIKTSSIQTSISSDSTQLRNQKALLNQLQSVDGNMVKRETQMLSMAFDQMKQTAELNSQNTGSLGGSSIEGGFTSEQASKYFPVEEKKASEIEKEEASEKLKQIMGKHLQPDKNMLQIQQDQLDIYMKQKEFEEKRGLLSNKVHHDKYINDIPSTSGFGAPKPQKALTLEKFKRAQNLGDSDISKMRQMGLELPKPAFSSADHMMVSTQEHYRRHFASPQRANYNFLSTEDWAAGKANDRMSERSFENLKNDIEGSPEYQEFLGDSALKHGMQLDKQYTTGLRRRGQDEIEADQMAFDPLKRQQSINQNNDVLKGVNNLIDMTKESEGFKMVDLKAQEEVKRNEAQADEIVDLNDDGTFKKKKKKKNRKKKNKGDATDANTTQQSEQVVAEDWRAELNATLKAEKANSDNSSSPTKYQVEEGNDDDYFDDDYYKRALDMADTPDTIADKADKVVQEATHPTVDELLTGAANSSKVQLNPSENSAIELADIDLGIQTGAEVPKIDFEQCKKSHYETLEKDKLTTSTKQTKKDSKAQRKKDAKNAQKEKKKEIAKQAETNKAQKKEAKRKEQLKTDEAETDPSFQQVQELESTQRQKELELPKLGELSDQKLPDHMILASSGPNLKQRDLKKFKRDKSYEDAQPPKRGSSRGTSLASKASSAGKAKSDPDLDALEEFFPKEVTKVQEATKSSINASLNNSKKNSPESSTQKDAATVAEKPQSIDAMALKQALELEQKKTRGQSSEPVRKVDLNTSNKKDRRSPTPPERRSEDLVLPNEPNLTIPEHEVKNETKMERQASKGAKKKDKAKQKKAIKDPSSPPQANVIEILRPDPSFKTQNQVPPKPKKEKPAKAKKKKEETTLKDESKQVKEAAVEKIESAPQITKVNLASQLDQSSQPEIPDMISQSQMDASQQQFLIQPPAKKQAIPQDRLQEILQGGGTTPLEPFVQNQAQQQNNMQMTLEYVRMTYNMQSNMDQQQQTKDDSASRQVQAMPNLANVPQQAMMGFNNMIPQQFQGIPPGMYQQQFIQMPANMTPQQVQGMLQNQFEQNFKMNQMMMQQPMNFTGQMPFQQSQEYIQQQMLFQQQMAQYNAQQQKFFYLQELRTKGYVINDTEMVSLAQQLQPAELEHVKGFYEVLDSQILKLQQDQEQKLQRSSQLRTTAFELIQVKIKEVYAQKDLAEQVKVEMFGSMATGLAIDSSDLDLLVHDFVDKNSPRFQQMSRQELIQEMHMLHQALDDLFAIESNTLIDTASVPVIKLTMDLAELKKKNPDITGQLDEETRILNVDITFDEPKKSDKQLHLGLQCCNYIKSRLTEYPKMRILALVFKKFLSLKNLNKPYLGGLSSYSLVQMILALLKLEEAAINYNSVLDQMKMSNAQVSDLGVGMIFKHFVHQYGYEFNAQLQGIDMNGQVQEKETFNYFLHAPTCNLNSPILIPDSLDDPIHGDLEDTCTCGFDRMMAESEDKDNDQVMHQILAQLLQGKPADKFDPQTEIAKSQKERKRAHAQANAAHLIIVDPLNRLNNIGKSSFNFAKIQQELRQIYERLNQELIRFCRLLAAKSKEESAETEADMIDGLIPRILDIDYKIRHQEEAEEIKASEVQEKKSLPAAVTPKLESGNVLSGEDTGNKAKQTSGGKKSGKKKGGANKDGSQQVKGQGKKQQSKKQ